jgi:putative glutamine transport system substrate-binding protein
MIKHLFCLLVSAIFSACSLSAQVVKGNSWAEIKSSGSGTLGIVYYDQPGLVGKGPDGKMKGMCVDIVSDFVAYIKTKYGKTVKPEYLYEEHDFPKFLSTFQQSHNMLGVTNTSITEERTKIMKFSPPFMHNDMVLLTSKDAPNLTDLSQIATVYKDFTAQVITGSTHVEYIQQIKKNYFPNLKIQYFPSGDIIIKNLSQGQKVFSVIDFTEYVGVIRNKIPVKKQNVNLGKAELLGFIMCKSSDWDTLWKEFLTPEYLKSLRYKEIVSNNLGPSFLSLVR